MIIRVLFRAQTKKNLGRKEEEPLFFNDKEFFSPLIWINFSESYPMSIFITIDWLHNPLANLSLLKKLLKLNKL